MGEYLAHLDALWLGALLALPVSLGVMAACRLGVRSPATRHALWLIALLAFVAPAIVATTSLPSALREWSAGIADLLPERPIPTDVPAAEATPVGLSQSNQPQDNQALDDQTPKAQTRTAPARRAPEALPALSSPESISCASDPKPSSSECSPRATNCASPKTTNKPEPDIAQQVALIAPVDEPRGPSWRERLAQQITPWVDGLRASVRSLRDVPPLPPLIWLGGITAFLTLLLVRLMIDRRVTRLALPATESERAALRQASATIGLRRPPELVFVPNRVSPMVTCGVRKRLVMPRSLWRVLDSDARQAVLLHELAHLRRKDHWVHWISLAVGALYWWHPLVWVIRARLRDEADLCCDAWVTALRPERRRGYAETLLKTTAYLNVPGVRTHAAGLAMASPTKRKLARRITMVMTHTVRPKLSVHGSSVVAGAALLALLVMPGVACPPAEKKAPEPLEVHVEAPEDSTFEQHMHERELDAEERRAVEREAHRRHERLRRLEAEAAQVRDRLSRLGRAAPDAPAAQSIFAQVPTAPDAPMVATTDAKVARAYHMPKGRLHALSTLMVRSDVPVLVSPEHERLVVHATRAQHQTFASFARLICPEGVKITNEQGEPVDEPAIARFSQGQAPRTPDQVRELAIARTLERHAQSGRAIAADRAALYAQRRALQSERDTMVRKSKSIYEEAERAYREAEKIHDQSDRAIEKADMKREKADQYQEKGSYEKAARYEAEAEALEAKAEELHRKSEDLERQAEDIERKAEEIERRAEELERKAESLERRAEELDRKAEHEQREIERHEDHHESDEHVHEHVHEHGDCGHDG